MTTTIENLIRSASDVKAIRAARELKGVSRKQMGKMLNLSGKTIEKIENGRMNLTENRLLEMLEVLKLTEYDLTRINKGRGLLKGRPEKKVISNEHRRSYQKNITKECRILKLIRKQRKISQDKASKLCGYSRSIIGHIENGRIELDEKRITHILKSYGDNFSNFNRMLNKEVLYDELIDKCVCKIETLSDDKLELVYGLLENF